MPVYLPDDMPACPCLSAAFVQVRRVLDQIRGRSYEEAIMILEYMPYKVRLNVCFCELRIVARWRWV